MMLVMRRRRRRRREKDEDEDEDDDEDEKDDDEELERYGTEPQAVQSCPSPHAHKLLCRFWGCPQGASEN